MWQDVKTKSFAYISAAALGIGACGTMQPPLTNIAQAELAIHQATQTPTAAQHAPLELRKASEKLAEAKAALAAEDFRRSQYFANEALVDAQLAEAKAEAEVARTNARELQEAIRLLRREASTKN